MEPGNNRPDYNSFRYRNKEATSPFIQRMGMILERKVSQLGEFYDDFPSRIGNAIEGVSTEKKLWIYGLGMTASMAMVASGVGALAGVAVATGIGAALAGVGVIYDAIKKLDLGSKTNDQPTGNN